MTPASFELRQYDLVVALRKAIRRMCGISPVRLRLEADWQNGKQRLVVSRGGPAVWVKATNEMLELSFSAVLAPRNGRETEYARKAFIRGDAVRIGRFGRVTTGVAVDSIRITRMDVSFDLDVDTFRGAATAEGTIDISGIVCLSDCAIDGVPEVNL